MTYCHSSAWSRDVNQARNNRVPVRVPRFPTSDNLISCMTEEYSGHSVKVLIWFSYLIIETSVTCDITASYILHGTITLISEQQGMFPSGYYSSNFGTCM